MEPPDTVRWCLAAERVDISKGSRVRCITRGIRIRRVYPVFWVRVSKGRCYLLGDKVFEICGCFRRFATFLGVV